MSTEPSRDRRPRPAALVVEDFRSVRRWLVVLGVIAVAAIAVAIYAVLEAGEATEEGQFKTTERSFEQRLTDLEARSEQQTDVEEFEARLRRTAEEGDLARLDRRVRALERDVVDAVDASADTGRALSRLEDRVARLERRRR